MSEEGSFELEGSVTPNGAEAPCRNGTWRERQLEQALAKLEAAQIEPQAREAYEATLGQLSALPLDELMWPDDDPRYNIHHAMGYGAQISARRAEIEARFGGAICLEPAFSIHRYAMAALHTFKMWRANPEPAEHFAILLREAAHTRRLLRSAASMLVQRKYLRSHVFRHFDGGVTVEALACDLFLLVGVLRQAFGRLDFQLLHATKLMEAELLAGPLLRRATEDHYPALGQATLQYARAITLLDNASYHAELVLSELHNEHFAPGQDPEWTPGCLFCACGIERQRHQRRAQSPRQTREHKQFVATTMTAILLSKVVDN